MSLTSELDNRDSPVRKFLFGIEKLGFYMSRQAQIIEWPIVNLLERLMGRKPPPLRDLRREFRDALTSPLAR